VERALFVRGAVILEVWLRDLGFDVEDWIGLDWDLGLLVLGGEDCGSSRDRWSMRAWPLIWFVGGY
jgi:hypothetical protein